MVKSLAPIAIAALALSTAAVATAKPKHKPKPKPAPAAPAAGSGAADAEKPEPASGAEAADAEKDDAAPSMAPAKDDPKKKKKRKGWGSPAAGPTRSGDPELVFTFDDGPNPKTTPRVLDALAKHHIKAIFFMVGERLDNPKKVEPIIERMLAEGHIIANHTMSHADLCKKKLSDEAAAAEIDRGKARIEEVTGVRTFWFRTPYGVRCDRLDKMLDDRHITHFHWDLDPQEWKHNNADKAFDYVTKQLAKATTRDVLLMHDIKEATAEALPRILDWIDEENARREQAHKRRIRIIQAPELAAERFSPELRAWVEKALPQPGTLGARIAAALP